ncbi:ATP synthase subunit I [Chengkuizengella sediminis]|uniref:ATP synthase subunit I n=1 Tax=Chengkuizengella sediminis TaxID=1885917 RepID=UPI00138A1321|nr:ATP synthase subunit I [Chengkuizengella sediminis]NDI36844.1 ATP synthase subunit I [Chengkuizengella sediminis]
MNNLSALTKNAYKITIYVLVACFVTWALLPHYRVYSAGLILGILVSLINARYLQWKIELMSEVAIKKLKRRVNDGFMTRASLSLIAVVISIKFEQHIAFSTTLAGLFFVQSLTFILGIISIKNSK